MTQQPRKASDVLGKMRKITQHEPPEQPAATPPPAPSMKRKVRYTLDLSPEQHRFLKRFAFDAEADATLVLRALLRLLETDQVLAHCVHELLEPSP